MEQIGYSLVDAGGNEVQFWGDEYGQCQGVPKYVTLANGNHIHGLHIGGTTGGMTLVLRYGQKGEAESVTWNGTAIVKTFPESTQTIRDRRVGEAWSACRHRIENDFVEVETTAGTHVYGTDAVTQDNISKVIIGVLTGATPNPRPWTPKNALAPVMLTHADINIVGAALMARVDAIIQAYLTHKAYLLGPSRTRAEIIAYDLTVGWPP